MSFTFTGNCHRCGESFIYERPTKRGRKRDLCDDCRTSHRHPLTSDVPHKFHVALTDQDREKLQFIVENLGTSRIEAIRTSVRVYHSILLRDMSRR